MLIYIALFFAVVIGLSIWCCCCVCGAAANNGKVVTSFSGGYNNYDAAGDEYNIN
jgi:hypothetical protein